MTTILDRIVAAKRDEIAAMKTVRPFRQVREEAAHAAPALDFGAALRGDRPRGHDGEARIIAEVKRRSPSRGEFPWHGDAARQARAYEAGGARAISVVTDGPFFGGTTDLLREVRAATTLPVVQKEFVLDPYQVFVARAIGADAVLLIAAILPGGLLSDLLATAREAGVQPLVEVVNQEELARATAAGAVVVGINNRDLRTFTTDPSHTIELLPHCGEAQVVVTESGIHTRADVIRMLDAGVDAFLIGEALMVADDPAAHLRELRGEARDAAPRAAGAVS